MARYEYRPNTCEWIEGGKCRLPTIRDKSYCEEHYPLVYRVMTDKEVDSLAESELSNVRHTPEISTLQEDD